MDPVPADVKDIFFTLHQAQFLAQKELENRNGLTIGKSTQRDSTNTAASLQPNR